MPRKKKAKALPSGIVVIVGIAFIFLFFSTTTLTISQVKSKNAEYQKKVTKRIEDRKLGLKIAKDEEQKMQEKIANEKKGVIISITKDQLVLEAGSKEEDSKEGEMLTYAITENTFVIMHSEIEGVEQQIVGDWASLAVGDIVSVREEVREGDERGAKIIRLKG